MSSIGMNLGMKLTLGQTIGPRMIQSMEILQMPLAELQERLDAELQENPFLEVRERTTDGEAPKEFNADGILKHDETGSLEFNRMDEINKDWGDHFDSDHRPSRSALEELGDRKLDMMQNVAEAPVSLQQHCLDQLHAQGLPADELELCEYVLSHLDNNGYLLRHDPDSTRIEPYTLEELAFGYAERPVTADDIEEAILTIQELDPPGLAARTTKECLLLQVPADSPVADVLRTIIRQHLEDVAYHRLQLIQKQTNYDSDDILEAVQELKTLDPKPGSRFATPAARAIKPEVVVERTEDGDYTVRLADDFLPPVRISKEYLAVKKDRRQPKPVRDMLKDKFQKAQWLLSAIEQRKDTLRRVTQEIVKHQRAFFDLGPDHIQPLKMEQIAERVGVHVTTVSRAVDDKYMQTPRGIFPLRRFFGGGMKSADGVDVAWETIKSKLLEFISEEDKNEPLSDEALVAKFTEAGLSVARRTVTKYREALKIPTSRQRRNWNGN
jgi:RNA polymerase sigma-54 factor